MGDVSHVTSIGYDEIEDNSYNDYNLLQLYHAGVRPNGQTTRTTFVARWAQRLTQIFFSNTNSTRFVEDPLTKGK